MRKAIAIAVLALAVTGCRYAAYQSPDGTSVVVGSLLTDPKIGDFSYSRTPTTQQARLKGYESASKEDVILEGLRKLP